MSEGDTYTDVRALEQAFQVFTKTTQSMEEAYRRLEARVHELDKELAAKNRQLALTSDYLNYILESMSDGVIAVDTNGTITTFNTAASAVLGYDADELIGRPFRDVFHRAFAPPQGRRAMELRAKNGSDVPVSECDSPISDRANNRIGYVKVFQDLSELESLREQVRQKDRLAAIGEMAATVAHEIRNPLGGIRGFAALLARDFDPGDPRARLVDKILVGAKDLDAIVNELLEYTRPVELRPRAMACADLVDAAIGYVESHGRPVSVVNAVPPALSVMADPDKMRHALLNILINALQSIEHAGEVRITASGGGESIALDVSDTGCGMSEDQLKRAFFPFFTTKEKGTGLGFAVAAKIVEGHGGRIDARSQPGKGSTFTVHLPCAE